MASLTSKKKAATHAPRKAARKKSARPPGARVVADRVPRREAPAQAQASPALARPPGLQARLEVGEPTNDPFEREAEQVADRVMRTPAPAADSSTLPPRKTEEEPPETRKDAAGQKVRRQVTPATASISQEEKPKEPAKSKEVEPPEKETLPAARKEKAGGTVPSVSPSTERSISRMRAGGGTPLADDARGFLEPRFQRPLDDVRVHADGAAGAAARNLDARAFTLGRDVFFAPGEYRPHSDQGRRLLAHEIAHVVQQTGAGPGRVAPRKIQRAAGDEKRTTPPPGEPKEDPQLFQPKNAAKIGKIERRGVAGKVGTITLPALSIPTVLKGPKGAADHPEAAIKGKPAKGKNEILAGKPFTFTGKSERGSTTARQAWLRDAKTHVSQSKPLKEKIEKKIKDADAPPLVKGTKPVGYLANKKRTLIIQGTADDLAAHEVIRQPTWDQVGETTFFDVDHLHEIQLGGFDGWENFWLFGKDANQESGRRIFHTMRKEVEGLVGAARKADYWKKGAGGPNEPTFEDVRASWRVVFQSLDTFKLRSKDRNSHWTRTQVIQGAHLDQLDVLNQRSLVALGLILEPGVTPKFINVFTGKEGGFRRRIELDDKGKPILPKKADEFYSGFRLQTIEYTNPDKVVEEQRVGALIGEAFRPPSKKKKKEWIPAALNLDILQSPGLGFGGYIDLSKLRSQLATLDFKPLSPIEVLDAGLTPGGALFFRAHILATKKLFPNLQIIVGAEGDTLFVDFPIPTDKLVLGPVSVTEATLRILYGEDGFALGGSVGIAVERLGRGRVVAEGLNLKGMFQFDFDFLDPAEIRVEYVDDTFRMGATLGVKEGKIPGVKSAEIKIDTGPEGPSVTGKMVLSTPPIAGTELIVEWTREKGLTIGADNIPLPVDKIPGVSGATANIKVNYNPETGAWKVSGGGTAAFGIPGVSGGLTIDVDGRLLTISGHGTVKKGILTGTANLTVTNRPTDDAGKPIEGEPLETFKAYGSGTATVQFGKILTGTVGLTILPNGEIELMGGVALPPTLDVFEQRKYEKDIFKPPSLDIPIFGITVAGQRIGIFATISGKLSFKASIGPGQLRDTKVEVIYNPDHPENAKITGGAKFAVPAEAGLRLAVRGGIGAGIPVVSATAGIELGGELGIGAEASAAVSIEWTPSTGLKLDALAKLEAQPRFVFDISAFLNVTADVFITEFELYDKKWKLKRFEFGSDLKLGAEMPVSWTEQAGLDFDVNKVKIIRPEIDIKDITGKIFKHLVS